MVNTQKTIGQEIGCAGIGMFRGENTTLHFKPALLNSGISFVRVDLPNRPRISAHVGSLSSNYRRIFLKRGDAEVECVEHLMAALAGLGIDNIEIEINGSEVPAGDGSAQLFVEILKKAGVVDLGGVKKVFVVKEPMGVNNGNASILAVPYEKGLALSYTLDFNNSFLQQQTYDIEVTEESFCREIASARTFGLSTYIEECRRLCKSVVKAFRLTEEWRSKLHGLSAGGESGTSGGAVKCVDIRRNVGGESDSLDRN